MKRAVLRVFFVVVIYHSVQVLATHGMDRQDNSSSHHSKVHQSSQVIADKGRQFTVADEVLNNSVETSPSAESTAGMTCPTWLRPKPSSNSTSCECGSSLGGLVECDGKSENVSLFKGYCMTVGVNESMLVVGSCLYGCFLTNGFHSYYPLPSNTSKLDKLCSRYRREGQLCGKCEDGFALPVYSYKFSCVNCKNDYASNWMKYLAASLLPLTLFLITIVTFRVRVTSGLMNAFLLQSQIVSLPARIRASMLKADCLYGSSRATHVHGVIASICGIWNLDFFRPLYQPFCLHPETTTVQVLALDYVVAVYPLFMLVVAYLLVKLYDSDVKLVVWMWRPFHLCFVHFRRDWNIKTSLIDAFATFLLLSYMKFLSVSSDLLTPVHILNIRGETLSKPYLYWDGTTEYFGSEHLPYAILALAAVVVFNIFPFLLLCLYPSRWFQQCLNCFRLHNHILYTFMDAFQGCYKDGTNGSCDCRWFAGLYLFYRILYVIILGVTFSNFSTPLFGCAVLVLLLLTAVLQPYKAGVHNHVNVFFLLVIVFVIISYMALIIASDETIQLIDLSRWIFGLSISIPPMYIAGVILYKLFGNCMCVRRMYQRLCRVCMKVEDEEYERLLPERMVNVDECAILSADPMQVSGSGIEVSIEHINFSS